MCILNNKQHERRCINWNVDSIVSKLTVLRFNKNLSYGAAFKSVCVCASTVFYLVLYYYYIATLYYTYHYTIPVYVPSEMTKFLNLDENYKQVMFILNNK